MQHVERGSNMAGRVFAPLSSGSRGDHVARALRSAIADGSLAPGQRLLETNLANELGTSNGPVREALRQLEAEGLVVSSPYRGAVVAEVSQEEIEQVLVPIRLLIERFAFQVAMPLLDEQDLAELRRLVGVMRSAADANDPDQLAEADLQFHELVIRRSGQNHCLQLWRVIQPRVRAYFRRDAPAHQDHYEVADQHHHLLDALTAGDPDALVTAVEQHVHRHLGKDASQHPTRQTRKAASSDRQQS
jgi:DNA-binding GntR family transcriptional regulator